MGWTAARVLTGMSRLRVLMVVSRPMRIQRSEVAEVRGVVDRHLMELRLMGRATVDIRDEEYCGCAIQNWILVAASNTLLWQLRC